MSVMENPVVLNKRDERGDIVADKDFDDLANEINF